MSKLLLSALLLFTFSCQPNPQNPGGIPQNPNAHFVAQTLKTGKSRIQVALLLDTSNSMDGLIDQAKAQLWKMVNRLADAKRQNEGVTLEIALYEYGNNSLDARNGYIRLVHPLNSDLDGLSEKLFSLKTNGGEEYCGWAIRSSLEEIPWTSNAEDLRIIVIAGNEPFNQGPVDFRTSCGTAADKRIIINTIHCGDYATGVNTEWKTGADIGKGRYMIIDTDQKVIHINTPYDGDIIKCNERLNKTYIGYGAEGEAKKERQVAQDANAASYGSANVAQRAAAKSKAGYKNEDWDLVDAAEADEKFVEKLRPEALPEPMKTMNKDELRKEIQRLSAERQSIRIELNELERKMNAFIAEESKKQASGSTLDNVLIEAVVEQAKALGFTF